MQKENITLEEKKAPKEDIIPKETMGPEENIVIGIEGYVGTGKTSLCRELLNYIPNSIVLHGNNIYRAITYGMMNLDKLGIKDKDILKKIEANAEKNFKENLQEKNNDEFNPSHKLNAKKIMDLLNLDIKLENRETTIYLNGIKITDELLQSSKNSMAVSKISHDADNKDLYEFGAKIIEKFKQKFNVILSSRDIVKMYPKVDYHFFIVADLEERAKRKYKQYVKEEKSTSLNDGKKGNSLNANDGKNIKNIENETKVNPEYDNQILEEIKEKIQIRDKLQEESGFYKIYPKTIVLDVTECKNSKEQVKKILNWTKYK